LNRLDEGEVQGSGKKHVDNILVFLQAANRNANKVSYYANYAYQNRPVF